MLKTLWVLIPAVLATATLSGIIGMGGGVILLAVMAAILPAPLVVPLHGVVQLVSNSTRTLRLLGDVNWRIVALYVPTLVVGVFLGLQLYSGERMEWFRPMIGFFLLAFLAWDRFRPKKIDAPLWVFAPAGLVGGVLAILVGATGPFLAAFFLRDDLKPREIVATKAAVQTVSHILKIPAFLSVGFDYGSRAPILAPLVGAAILGTLAGTWLLHRMETRLFRAIFRWVLALLAIRLVMELFV